MAKASYSVDRIKQSPEEFARQLAKQDSSRKRAKRDDLAPHADPGDNTKYLAHSLEIFSWPSINRFDE